MKKKEKAYIVERRGHPGFERTICIREGWFSNNHQLQVKHGPVIGFINPQAEVWRATGVSIDRQNCMISFMNGLKAAGYRVYVDEAFIDRKFRFYEHVDNMVTVPEYHFIGLAWAKKCWPSLKQDILQCPFQVRFDVLQQSAHYFNQHPNEILDIFVPAGYLIFG